MWIYPAVLFQRFAKGCLVDIIVTSTNYRYGTVQEVATPDERTKLCSAARYESPVPVLHRCYVMQYQSALAKYILYDSQFYYVQYGIIYVGM